MISVSWGTTRLTCIPEPRLRLHAGFFQLCVQGADSRVRAGLKIMACRSSVNSLAILEHRQ